MPGSTLHSPGKSILHRANPFTKLTAVLFVVMTAFVLRWEFLWIAAVTLLLASFLFEVGSVLLLRYLTFAAPFSLAILVFQGLILARPDYHPLAGWLQYSPEGLRHGALLSGRISLMLAASLLFIVTTSPSDLLKAFDHARWPPGVSFLLASPLLLIDQFRARADSIRSAQQTRGLATNGSPKARLFALRILLVPLLTTALSDAQERSHVLTARGFRALPYRTVVDPPADSLVQRRLRHLLIAIIFLQLFYLFWR